MVEKAALSLSNLERDEDRSAQQIGSQGEVTGVLYPDYTLTAWVFV
jgi:hypothetical protein